MHAPSRQTHRDQRARYRRAKVRQWLVGIPLAMVGIALIGLGTYSFLNGRSTPSGVQVGGLTIERPTTSTTTTASTAGQPDGTGEDASSTGVSPLAGLPMPGTAETSVVAGETFTTPDRSETTTSAPPGP